jgi:hypothetical protein
MGGAFLIIVWHYPFRHLPLHAFSFLLVAAPSAALMTGTGVLEREDRQLPFLDHIQILRDSRSQTSVYLNALGIEPVERTCPNATDHHGINTLSSDCHNRIAGPMGVYHIPVAYCGSAS